MNNNKFPWNCGDCPMLKTYDMSIDDLTHICLWSKKQIDDCDRYKSAECPLADHDTELLDKVAERINNLKYDTCDAVTRRIEHQLKAEVFKVIEEMKAEVENEQ